VPALIFLRSLAHGSNFSDLLHGSSARLKEDLVSLKRVDIT
jgi:hypothetical protein